LFCEWRARWTFPPGHCNNGGRYKGKWSPSMIADSCWTLMHDSPNLTFSRQAKKARLHYATVDLWRSTGKRR
jgi:hypothetical protein